MWLSHVADAVVKAVTGGRQGGRDESVAERMVEAVVGPAADRGGWSRVLKRVIGRVVELSQRPSVHWSRSAGWLGRAVGVVDRDGPASGRVKSAAQWPHPANILALAK